MDEDARMLEIFPSSSVDGRDIYSAHRSLECF